MENQQASHYPGYFSTTNGTNGYNGYSDLYCMMSLSHQIAELRRDIGETECGLKESLHAQSLAHSKEFCDVNKNISDNGYRNVIATKDMGCILDKSILETRSILAEKVDRETDVIKERLTSFERSVDHNFCSVRTEIKDSTRLILDRLAADKLEEKQNQIDELRHDKRHLQQLNLFANEFNGLKTMINSVEQNQRFSSKTVQFGAGNVALPVQTANQG